MPAERMADGGEPADGPTEVLVEVTDTVSVPYTTGLQRVARELLRHLPAEGDPRFRPVVWSPVCDGFRSPTISEVDLLQDPPERLPRTTRISKQLPVGVAEAARRVLATPAARRSRALVKETARRRVERDRRVLCLPEPSPPAVLLDLEAAWNDPIPRTELLERLSGRGVRSAALVADVLPVLHPEWFDDQLLVDFDRFLDGHLAHSDLFLCISERTRSDLLAVAAARGVRRELDARVVPLGADLAGWAGGASGEGDSRAPVSEPSRAGTGLPETVGRYLLVVGTIEPRKNQALALDVLDELARTHPDLSLVLVGKRGWKVDELIRRIETHPGRGSRLVWLEEVDDERLAALYRHAFLCLTPALYEGLGVTVMEALLLGTPVVSSTGGALPEAGGDAAEYADPDDTAAWVELVRRHLDDDDHHRRVRSRVAAWQAPTWSDSAAAVLDAVSDVFCGGYSTP